MPRRTVTRKYADELHRTIRLRDQQIAKLQRDIQHQNDRLDESKRREDVLQIDRDALAVKVDKMGQDLGCANMRELCFRDVAATALSGIATVASSLHATAWGHVATTLRALERDGREQLKKASNGAHA